VAPGLTPLRTGADERAMAAMARRARVTVAIVATAALAMGACTEEDSEPPATSSASRTAERSSAPGDQVVETDDYIDVGGLDLYLHCWGEPVPGEPTVLLVAGQGPPLAYWGPMAADLAASGHHLCAYDRAGAGNSDPPPEDSRTTTDQVRELVALLDAADLNEPLVVVAHSLGSLPAIGLVDQAAERVAGVVLVDPWAPRVGETLASALPPEKPDESAALAEERHFHNEFRNDPAQNSENLHVAASDDEVITMLDKPGPLFGDRLVIVLQAPFPPRAAGLPRSYDEVARAAWTEANVEFAAESTRGRVVKVEDTGHDIHVDQPDVVIDAIREVLAG